MIPSPTQRDVFHRDGFLVVTDLATPTELTLAARLVDHILASRIAAAAARSGGDTSFLARGETLWVRLAPEESLLLGGLRAVRSGRDLAAALLEVEPADLDVGLRLFVKPPQIGQAMPFHQDEAHKDPAYIHRSINLWIPLDPATPESGCLRYEPGSHLGPVRPHYLPEGPYGAVSMITDAVALDAVVDAPVPLGGACLHHARTLHGSHPNRAPFARRALVAVLAAPPVPKPIPELYPWMPEGVPRYPETSFG